MNDNYEENITPVMHLFVTIYKLSMYMPFDKAVDALDKYIKTGDM